MSRRFETMRLGILATLVGACLGPAVGVVWGEPAPLVSTGGEAVLRRVTIRPDLLDEYLVRVWDGRHGLPQNHINTVVRDRDGYLWIATWVGLVRFNGTDFLTFTPANTPAFRDATINDLLLDRDGRLWIATHDGLYWRDGADFRRVGIEEGLPHQRVTEIYEDRQGVKWLTTPAGICRFADGVIRVFRPPPPERDITDISYRADGTAVVITDGEPLTFDPESGQFNTLSPLAVPDWPAMRPELLPPDRDGTTWFRTLAAIYWLPPDGEPRRWRALSEDLVSERVLLLTDRRGDVWFAGDRPGVLERYSRGVVARLDLGASHQVTSYNEITEDRDGVLWVSTGQGLIQLTPRAVRTYGRRHGMLHDYVFSAMDWGDGRGLLGTRQWPVLLDVDRLEMTLLHLPTAHANARSVLAEPGTGGFWVNESTLGPLHIDAAGIIRRLELAAGWPKGADQMAFCRDSRRRLWIGTESGLFVLADGELRQLKLADHPEFDRLNVRVVMEARDGSIWLGGRAAGIWVLAPEATSLRARHDPARGLSHGDVWTLCEEPAGTVWAGTANGLNRIQADQCRALRPADGLVEGMVHQILRDHHGYFWLTGMQGIYRVHPGQLSAVLDGQSGAIDVLPVTTDDGLISGETNGEQQPAGFTDPRGRLWIPTIAGVAVLDPARFMSNAPPDRPVLERIIIDGEVIHDTGPGAHGGYSPGQVIRLPAGRGRLVEIHFAAPAVSLFGTAQYEICLNGHESNWRPVGRQTQALFTNLRPGYYEFDLRVIDHRRRASAQATDFRFRLAPHPHETWWFWTLVVLAAGAGGYWLHRRRLGIASHIQELEQRDALVSERGRIARDMHDDLGSRLTHISLLADMARRRGEPPDSTRLQELNLAAREAARSVEEIVWAANPGNDTVAGLLGYLTQHAEGILGAAGISFRVRSDFDWPAAYVSPQTRHAVFMAFKEAVHNAVKHSGATEVRLTITPEPTGVYLTLADNGRGFASEDPRPRDQDGLDNMAARLAGVGGRFVVDSAPGRGVKVEFWLPLPAPEVEDPRDAG